MRRLALAALLAIPSLSRAQERGAAALGALVDGLGTSARVLVVGAHPDDEPSALLAFLARGRRVRTAYLSLTRGEGGANLLGAETGEALGMIRTAESLDARRVDGAEQYFTRAYDFGASKTGSEALSRWSDPQGGRAALADLLTIVRTFRPHVIVSVYDGVPADGHGQHQAAGRLVREAFASAADTSRALLPFGRPWPVAALYRVVRPEEADAGLRTTVRLNVGEYSSTLGATYAEIGAEARARHRTQGGIVRGALGTAVVRLERIDSLTRAAQATDAPTLFGALDTTLARVDARKYPADLAARIDSLAPLVAAVRTAYRPADPSTAVAPLATLTRVAARAAALTGGTSPAALADPDAARSLEDLWRRARAALVLASGVAVEATAEREVVAQATAADSTDSVRVQVAVYARGVPVRVQFVAMTGAANVRAAPGRELAADSVWRGTLATAPRYVTQPWWVANGRSCDLYLAAIDGRSEREMQETNDAGALVVSAALRVDGVDALVTAPVVYRSTEPSRVAERPVAVVPAVSVRFDNASQYARAGTALARPLRLTIQSAYAAPRDVKVTLKLPPGLTADSATRQVTIPGGATGVLAFTVRGTPKPGPYDLKALVNVGADEYGWGSSVVAADHVPPQRRYFPAQTTIKAVSVAFPPSPYVGYVAAANDGVSLKLSELGIPVTLVDPNGLALPTANLSRFSALVVSPRAFELSPALLSANDKVLSYARAGGAVVTLGGQAMMEQPGVLPFPIALSRPPLFVTQEGSPVRPLVATARVLRAPNVITVDDFADWVQDRAAFVPVTFDARWQAPIAVADVGETPLPGALLVAPYGRGTYTYTTLSLPRQLLATNPGAARLFVNLLAQQTARE